MLDDEHARLTKFGTVTISSYGNPNPSGCRIFVEGFEAENGTCRDVSALAALWAIGELQRELMETLERPGGGDIGID